MKTKKLILGIAKILLAVCIAVNAFDAVGPQRGLFIWLGLVVAFPLFLWGVLDFVKKDIEENEENDHK